MRLSAPILSLSLIALAACGGGDADEAAPAAAINTAIAVAEEDQQAAEDVIKAGNVEEGRAAANARGEKLAEETMARADAANREASASDEITPPIPE